MREIKEGNHKDRKKKKKRRPFDPTVSVLIFLKVLLRILKIFLSLTHFYLLLNKRKIISIKHIKFLFVYHMYKNLIN